jgi:hypothetical protein
MAEPLTAHRSQDITTRNRNDKSHQAFWHQTTQSDHFSHEDEQSQLTFMGNQEPILEDVLSDPMLWALMNRDGVQMSELRDHIKNTREWLRVASTITNESIEPVVLVDKAKPSEGQRYAMAVLALAASCPSLSYSAAIRQLNALLEIEDITIMPKLGTELLAVWRTYYECA